MKDDAVIYQPSLWQQRFHATTRLGVRHVLGAGSAGPGKRLSLDTPIATPNGFVRMGDIRVGMKVFDEKGQPCNVVYESPVAIGAPTRKVVFDDGTHILADDEHLWFTSSYRERNGALRRERKASKREYRYTNPVGSVRTTAEIAESLTHLGRANHSVDVCAPLQLPARALPLEPYIFGAWLGDGTKGFEVAGFQVTSMDPEIVQELQACADGYGMRLVAGEQKSRATSYRISGTMGKANALKDALRAAFADDDIGIPPDYMFAARFQREALLQGLVDTDGHVDRDGRVEITSVRKKLSEDTWKLCCGLGFKATISEGVAKIDGRVIGPKWRVCFSPMGRQVARLARKQSKVGAGSRTQKWRYIKSAERVESVPMKCIQVDSPSKLYLAGYQCVPTHNTTALLYDAVDQITVEHERCASPKHKHHQAWGDSTGWALHLRRTTKQLVQTIRLSQRAFRAIDPGAQWNEQQTTWTFSSGYRYQFGHCKDPNDWESFMSSAFSAIYFDELTAFNEEQYDQITTRLRSDDPVLSLMLKVRSMSNPLMRKEGGEQFVVNDPHWVRKRFVDPHPKGDVIHWKKIQMSDGTTEKVGWLYMPARLSDNPNKAFVRQYEITLREQKPHIRQALLEGDWYVTAGSFFAEYWKRSLHVCKPFKCPRDWRFFRSMDWGFKAPGVIHWYAMDEDETLYVIRELKFQGKLASEVAAMVQVVETDLGLWDESRRESRITGVADTQLWEQRGQSGKNMGEEFAAKGVRWRRADKKNRQTNAGHIIKRLADHDDETKTPGVLFFESCTYIIQTLPAIQTSVDNSEEPQSGGDDHAYDGFSYGVAFASRGRLGIPETAKLREPWEYDDETALTSRRGRHGYGQELC